MATKKFDIAVKVGEYTAKDGTLKGRWQNVGAVMEGDGGPFIMLAKWFSPAGVPDARGGESILLSCFPPKERDGGQRENDQREQPAMRVVREVPSAAKTAAVQRAAKVAPVAGEDGIPF